jgi:hypothetical protein
MSTIYKIKDQIKASFATADAENRRDLAVAETLFYGWHWLVGCCVVLIVCAFENLPSLIDNPSGAILYAMLGGLPVSVLSRSILMLIIPAPYARLATRLNVG